MKLHNLLLLHSLNAQWLFVAAAYGICGAAALAWIVCALRARTAILARERALLAKHGEGPGCPQNASGF